MYYTESDNFNAEQIADEAERLSRVIAMIEERIAELENDKFEYRSVNMYDQNDLEEFETEKLRYEERKAELKLLKKSLATPYFARMRLKPVGRISGNDDAASMTRARSITEADDFLGEDADIYVGANVIVYRNKIIVFSHNSPLGNKVYERFENGTIEYEGYVYKVIFRRKFDIRAGKLEAVFQDYSIEAGGVVYDKFLAHMLEIKRGDKRLTDIIPTIQANQNAVIVRPATENCVVSGCAGCGKTMLLLQRLEYLTFNKKIELDNAVIISPSERYIEHIQPVVDDLMINAARRLTMQDFYRTLILSLRGVKASARKALNDAEAIGDEGLADETVSFCYGDTVKRKLISALGTVKQSYAEKMTAYRKALDLYEREQAWARDTYGMRSSGKKPPRPVMEINLKKFAFLPDLGDGLSKCKLYLLLTAYCYVLGKPEFDGTLFIDEGQDYFFNEYKLLSELTRATVDIYGDTRQQLVPARGIGDFSRLDALWDAEHYSLNENYRNAREITEYVNGILGMNVTSLGLDGGVVQKMNVCDIPAAISSCGDDRVAVIYSKNDTATAERLFRAVPPEMLYTVTQCKGMEYERVYACGEMTDAEKYVAYTRALGMLYICE